MASTKYENPEPPEDKVVWWCSICSGEIYAGEEFYRIDGRAVCPDCLSVYAERLFADKLEIAEAEK